MNEEHEASSSGNLGKCVLELEDNHKVTARGKFACMRLV